MADCNHYETLAASWSARIACSFSGTKALAGGNRSAASSPSCSRTKAMAGNRYISADTQTVAGRCYIGSDT